MCAMSICHAMGVHVFLPCVRVWRVHAQIFTNFLGGVHYYYLSFSFKGVGMELALRSILPVEAFIQLRMAAHRGFFPFPVS